MHIMWLMQPGRLLPLYSSNTETYAQPCCLLPLSSLDTHEKSSRALQNHTLSILSWKGQKGAPGGRIKTQSWRLVFLSFWDANGQHSTRCSPGNCWCPMWRDENSLRWPSDRTELISSNVSRRLLIWNNANYAVYVNYAIYSNYASLHKYKNKQRRLEEFEHSMHVHLTPIFGQRRNVQACMGFSMVLKKISTQLVREHRPYFVRPILPTFAMQNWFPWDCNVAHVMFSTTCQKMR